MVAYATWRRIGQTAVFVAASFAPFAGCKPRPSTVSVAASPVPWTRSFDFDGDGLKDEVQVSFSGGAHCCYRLSVRLKGSGEVHRLPFQIDGGYLGGLDLSRPKQFDIRRTDGALPELVMEIEHYNGIANPLPETWTAQYGFRTHHIAVGFPEGRLRVRDWPQAD